MLRLSALQLPLAAGCGPCLCAADLTPESSRALTRSAALLPLPSAAIAAAAAVPLSRQLCACALASLRSARAARRHTRRPMPSPRPCTRSRPPPCRRWPTPRPPSPPQPSTASTTPTISPPRCRPTSREPHDFCRNRGGALRRFAGSDLCEFQSDDHVAGIGAASSVKGSLLEYGLGVRRFQSDNRVDRLILRKAYYAAVSQQSFPPARGSLVVWERRRSGMN